MLHYYWEFTVHLIFVKILPYARAIEKNLCILRMQQFFSDR